MSIWIHYLDVTGNASDYSVTDWEAARLEAVRLVESGLNFITDAYTRNRVEQLLVDNWQAGVSLFNDTNALGEQVLLHEGKRVFEPEV